MAKMQRCSRGIEAAIIVYWVPQGFFEFGFISRDLYEATPLQFLPNIVEGRIICLSTQNSSLLTLIKLPGPIVLNKDSAYMSRSPTGNAFAAVVMRVRLWVALSPHRDHRPNRSQMHHVVALHNHCVIPRPLPVGVTSAISR